MVALVDSGGSSGRARVVGQWTYDAYGNVLSTDHLHPHAYTRVGHKGLIFDRLDVGVADRGDDGNFTAGQFVGHPGCDFDTPRIVPFARGFYHNRNRVYMPELGRFAQADPNASGQTLLDLPVYYGSGFSAATISFDVQARYGDGGSLFAYLGGNPWQRSDPMGLWIQLAGNAVGIGMQALRGGLENMIAEYGDNMSADIDWAMDWSLPDDWHSRTENEWVAAAFRRGMNAAAKEALLDALGPINQLEEFVTSMSVGSAAGTITRVIKVGGKVVRKGHLHHLLPKYLARVLGKESKVLARLPERLHKKYHYFVDNAMRKPPLEAPYMRAPRSEWNKWIKKREEAGIPAQQSLDQLQRSLTRLTRQFAKDNDITGLAEALKEAL